MPRSLVCAGVSMAIVLSTASVSASGPVQGGAGDPMAAFARMLPGEWKTTAAAGTSMFDTWHWGPGRHSARVVTEGAAASGAPWRELRVFYWHPGHKGVRLLGLSPFSRGVSEGSVTFDGGTANGVFDLYQTDRRRKMGLRWVFDGPDRYHDTLLEATGPNGFAPMNEFDRVRVKPPAVKRPWVVTGPSERLKVFVPLLGHTWDVKGGGTAASAAPVRATFEYVPFADAVYARVVAPGNDGASGHLFDVYLYHHVGADALRCLVLSSLGGVYEGDLVASDGGALQLDLKGFEGDRTDRFAARVGFNAGGGVSCQIWSVTGAGRTPVLDLHSTKAAPKKE